MSTVKTGMRKTPGKKKTLSSVKDLPAKMAAKKKKPCGCVDKLSGLLQNDFRVDSAYNFRTGESVTIVSVTRDKKLRDGKKTPVLYATYCPFVEKNTTLQRTTFLYENKSSQVFPSETAVETDGGPRTHQTRV